MKACMSVSMAVKYGKNRDVRWAWLAQPAAGVHYSQGITSLYITGREIKIGKGLAVRVREERNAEWEEREEKERCRELLQLLSAQRKRWDEHRVSSSHSFSRNLFFIILHSLWSPFLANNIFSVLLLIYACNQFLSALLTQVSFQSSTKAALNLHRFMADILLRKFKLFFFFY